MKSLQSRLERLERQRAPSEPIIAFISYDEADTSREQAIAEWEAETSHSFADCYVAFFTTYEARPSPNGA